jgi:hypothetical protein
MQHLYFLLFFHYATFIFLALLPLCNIYISCSSSTQHLYFLLRMLQYKIFAAFCYIMQFLICGVG